MVATEDEGEAGGRSWPLEGAGWGWVELYFHGRPGCPDGAAAASFLFGAGQFTVAPGLDWAPAASASRKLASSR